MGEKEEYSMVSTNEAPDSSGPSFKASSKRRIYIVVGVVCLLILVAVAVALGVYFGVHKGQDCEMNEITLTVKSSDCNTPVADVTITSSAAMTITEMEPGIYVGEVCGMPATFSLQKEGFDPMNTTVTGASENVTLTCSGPVCTVQTANVSVTANCAATPVVGVAIRGQDVINVSSSAPGFYQIDVCSQPTLVKFERIGYASQQTTISGGSTVTLSCESPVIVEDPQSKYRREGEDVKLCCQAEPASGVAYKWYKDGAELTETSNELMLSSLVSDDKGLYQCSAKLTADPNLPAVRSEEAMLTIRAASDDCGDARRPMEMEVFPGCTYDVGQCLKRPCRSTGSGETCSDDNVCCENTQIDYPYCARGNGVTVVVSCACNCHAPSAIIVRGTVEDSYTDLPLAGITVMLVGSTIVTTTDANGEFSFNSVPSSRRRFVIKASDSAGTYLDNYVVETISRRESFGQVTINIAMIKKASFIEINPVVENTMSVSSDPAQSNTGSAYIKVPAKAFYNTDGTQYTRPVFVSLTYLDPSERLEDAPGEFVTLNPEGLPEILVTLGVFSIEFEDDSGNQFFPNDNIEVFAYRSTPYLLWQLDEHTGTWVLIHTLPGRKKRQDTPEQLIRSFTPQSGSWYNIDYVYSEPDCFFKIRVFQINFSKENEVTSGLAVIPNVRQILALNDGNGVKYRHGESMTGCFRIKCPDEIAKAKISVASFFPYVGIPLMPATIGDYSTGIKSILQPGPYSYTLLTDDASKIFVNTRMAETGPFYPNMDSCDASTFDEPAFWFAKPPEFVESEFYDGSEDRCVGKFKIYIGSVMDPDLVNNVVDASIDILSIWSDSKYGLKVAPIQLIAPISTPQSGQMYFIEAASCFEYRCSVGNAMTSVFIDFSNRTIADCPFYVGTEEARYSGSRLYPPILNSSEIQEGYFFNGVSDVQEAIDRCEADAVNYAGFMNCYPYY